jgi:hypothetical protein
MGPSMLTLWELSDGFGGRLTGSAAYQGSAEWAVKKFTSYGLQNVHLEPFEIPNAWQRGTARGELTAPMVRPLHVASVAWCPSTPEGGIEGEVVLVDDLSPDHIKSQAAQIKGRIVLLDNARIFEQGLMKALPVLFASYPHLKDAGALGILYPDREKDNVLNAHDSMFGGKMNPLPDFEVGMEDAKLLRRLLDAKQTVRVKLEADNKTSGATVVNNVIAEIRGREHPDEWVWSEHILIHGISVPEHRTTVLGLPWFLRRHVRLQPWVMLHDVPFASRCGEEKNKACLDRSHTPRRMPTN